MTDQLTTPTVAEALGYAHDVFDEWRDQVIICGTIAPGRDSSGPLEGTRDVLLVFKGDAKPRRLNVWREADGAGSTRLYGKW